MMTTALLKSSELTSGMIFRLIRSPPSTGRREVQADAVLLELDRERPEVPLRYRIRELTAGEKLASLPLSAIRFGSAGSGTRPCPAAP
jgi:hypothetical protein